jgi:hypothetical protein
MQIDNAYDLMWACTTDTLEPGGYYVGRRAQQLRAPARDPAAVVKLWDIAEVQTGTHYPAMAT